MIKIIICGGRNCNVWKVNDWLVRNLDVTVYQALGYVGGFKSWKLQIIEGGAKGADAGAREFAKTQGVDFLTVPANWDLHGRAAGIIRNRQMADMKPDLVIAFPGGRGTDNMISESLQRDIPVFKAGGDFT